MWHTKEGVATVSPNNTRWREGVDQSVTRHFCPWTIIIRTFWKEKFHILLYKPLKSLFLGILKMSRNIRWPRGRGSVPLSPNDTWGGGQKRPENCHVLFECMALKDEYRFPSLFSGVTFLRNLDPRIPKPLFYACIYEISLDLRGFTPLFWPANNQNREYQVRE